jgi:hypothetical protein
MLNICFTADHELFFGKNFASEEEILIKPTYRLLETLEEYNVPLSIMTDVCSVLRYKELDIESNYPFLMEEQLRYALKRGHDIQLHLHPHWLTSEYLNGSWRFDHSKYRLHSLESKPDTGNNVRQIIAKGKQYLQNLLTPIDLNYKCVAFRAGGWCLQPEKEIIKALVAEGIRIDTTVYYNGFTDHAAKYYDFRRVPQKPCWWVDPEKGLEYEAAKSDDNIFEVAIGSYGSFPMNAWKKIVFKPSRMKIKDRTYRAKGISIDDIGQKSRAKKIISKGLSFIHQPIMFSFDSACLAVMLEIMSYYLKTFDCENQELYLSIIGHPKILNESSLREIRKFCAKVTQEYSNIIRFTSLQNIALQL